MQTPCLTKRRGVSECRWYILAQFRAHLRENLVAILCRGWERMAGSVDRTPTYM